MVKAIDIVIAVNVQKCIFRKFITDAMNFLVQTSAILYLCQRETTAPGKKCRTKTHWRCGFILLTRYKEIYTVQKMNFSIKNFLSKCDQVRSFMRIWSHLLKKSSMENFIFCGKNCLAEKFTGTVESSSRTNALEYIICARDISNSAWKRRSSRNGKLNEKFSLCE